MVRDILKTGGLIMFLLQVLNINWFQKHQDGNDEVAISSDCVCNMQILDLIFVS